MDWNLISAGLSAFSGFSNSRTTQKTLINNSNTLKEQAELLDKDATEQEKKGFLLSQNYKGNVKRLKGRQVSLFSSSGVTVGVGSAGDVTDETEILGKIEQNIILKNAMGKGNLLRDTARIKINQSNKFAQQAEDENPMLDGLLSGAITFLRGK